MHTRLTEGICPMSLSSVEFPIPSMGVGGGGAGMDISGTIHCKEKSNVYLYRITCR